MPRLLIMGKTTVKRIRGEQKNRNMSLFVIAVWRNHRERGEISCSGETKTEDQTAVEQQHKANFTVKMYSKLASFSKAVCPFLVDAYFLLYSMDCFRRQ